MQENNLGALIPTHFLLITIYEKNTSQDQRFLNKGIVLVILFYCSEYSHVAYILFGIVGFKCLVSLKQYII